MERMVPAHGSNERPTKQVGVEFVDASELAVS
jgi:hypothetical protein